MVKVKTITNLYIDNAQYVVTDENGERVIVKINYSQSKFSIIGNPQQEFLKDIQFFAKDLIARKSRVNFA